MFFCFVYMLRGPGWGGRGRRVTSSGELKHAVIRDGMMSKKKKKEVGSDPIRGCKGRTFQIY